jgi:hypothetical protein
MAQTVIAPRRLTRRYAIRTDRPRWRVLLGHLAPCWCVTHKPWYCTATVRRRGW